MSQLADRYATALYEATKKSGSSAQVLETLVALKESIADNKQIMEILSMPLISPAEKQDVLKSAVGQSFNEELGNFFQLLARNNRLGALPSIVTSLQEKTAEDLGVVAGKVRSAVELSEQEKAEVKKIIESQLSSSVELKFQVDPEMIGGIEAKVGSYIFEDSIKSHMQKLNDFITRRVQ